MGGPRDVASRRHLEEAQRAALAARSRAFRPPATEWAAGRAGAARGPLGGRRAAETGGRRGARR